MGQSPFARSSNSISPPLNRRRSTRIEHVASIVISGRNASGAPFREATETIAVSAHGATCKTHNQILIGMQLMVENVLDGIAEKAICVRVVEPEAGQGQNIIAIQLLHPKNLWGVKDPPSDWQFALGIDQPEPPQAPAPSHAAVIPSSGGSGAARTPQAPPPGVSPITESEQRAAEFAESVLVLLRRQAAGMLRESLKEFEDRLKGLETETLHRLTRQSEKSVAEADAALNELRQNTLQRISGQVEKAVGVAEESLRERIAELFSPRHRPDQETEPEKKTGTD